MAARPRSSILSLPSTRLGWWAFGLEAAFIIMSVLNSTVMEGVPETAPYRTTLLPFYGILMLASGLAAGILAVIALLKKAEKSWLAWTALLPGIFVLIFLLGEFLFPH